MHYVEQFWNERQGTGNWRNWKKIADWGQGIVTEQGEELDKEMSTRKVTIRMGPYSLRWGHSTKGTFTIKEAYKLKAE